MIRDIGLFPVENFNSDIDLVFSGSKKELHNALSVFGNMEPQENKFGGLRLKLAEWDIDIWSIEDTWAFDNNYVAYNDVNDLLETTFMSWDSALYNIRTKKIIKRDNYFDNLSKRHLDLVLEKTPNEIGSFVRLASTILNKDVKTVSSKVISLLDLYSSKFSTFEVLEYERESFCKKSLTKSLLLDLYSSVEKSDSGRFVKEGDKYYISKFLNK